MHRDVASFEEVALQVIELENGDYALTTNSASLMIAILSGLSSRWADNVLREQRQPDASVRLIQHWARLSDLALTLRGQVSTGEISKAK